MTSSFNLDGITALVIDDDPDLLDLLTVALKVYNMEVLTAQSAKLSLQMLRSHQPDILICDIGMPEQDGYELIGELRQQPDQAGGNIPAIALTSYAGDHNRHKALKAGFQIHLSKPVDLEQLGTAIAQLVD